MKINRYPELLDLVKNLEKDFDKFYNKENNAAGTRLRHGMQELKNLAQSIRISVQEVKKNSTEVTAKAKASPKKVLTKKK